MRAVYLAVTGTFYVWTRGVRFGDLLRSEWWSTGFGHAFGAKLVLVAIALAITVVHERTTPGRARLLGRALLLVALAIVAAAVEDGPRRFGRSLDEFLQAPTGTMSMVLSTGIPLTPEQRALAADKLKQAYRAHQESKGIGRAVASH